MRLSVKVVGGSDCECDASPDSSVEALKRDVEVKLNLGKDTEQKLLFRGKALQGKMIVYFGVLYTLSLAMGINQYLLKYNVLSFIFHG